MRKPARAAVPEAVAAKMADSVVAMVLGQALAGAIAKGYQVVLVPGGDPAAWRDLADRAARLLKGGDPAASGWPEYAEQVDLWRADYEGTVAAYTIQTPASGVGAGDDAGGMGTAPVQPTPKPPGEPS